MPTVSVILPFFNRAATLPRCVKSVLEQTFANWELVAVDDGSSDASASIVESFGDSRIRLLRHEQNRGAGPARDTAMAAATGEYLALIDSDDEWLPGKLAAQLAAIEAAEGKVRLSSCAYEFHRDGAVIHWPKPFNPASWEKSLHRECTFGFGTTLLIERKLAQELGPFDPELPRHEDWDWILRAFEAGESLAFVPEVQARVYCTAPPPLGRFIPSTHRFLSKHDGNLRKFGEDYRRQVVAYHYESVASMAYEQRAYATGHEYLIRSYAMWPWRSPLALAALPLGLLDWALGTRIIQWGANLRRALFDKPVAAST